jgi:hypothetical protein
MRRLHARLAAACALAVATATFTGVAFADPGNGNSANAPGQQAQTQPAPAPQSQPAAAPQSQAPSQAPGQAKKQAAPTQAQPSSSSPGQAKQAAKASSSSPGVKPASGTTHWTHCTTGTSSSGVSCTSSDSGHTPQTKTDVSKQYGNGQTAAQIAVSRGGVGVQLTGPGNSQPHKVTVCGKPSNKSGGVDVHAVKSYDASACATATVTPSVTQSETHVCGATTISTTSTQVVGVLHGKSPHLMTNTKSAHFTKHDDQPVVATSTQTQVVPTGEVCSSARSTPSTPSVQSSAQASQSAQSAPATPATQSAQPQSGVAAAGLPATQSTPATSATGGVLGAHTTLATPKPHHGVLGTVTHVAGSTLPFTGFPVWLAVLIAAALILAGVVVSRRSAGPARL